MMYHHLPKSYLSASSSSSWLPPPPGVDVSAADSSSAAAADPLVSALKRSSDVLYHPTLYGAHYTLGQTEAWYSTDYLAKRPRYESTSHLPIYPQRPGEKDCAHYMLTRTCKFGDTCKFDHPIWVPEGGIPDWKEVQPVTTGETPPERPGEPDCPYFLKTQRCKFGSKCKFNHPKDKLPSVASGDVTALPERPSEPLCAFYLKTGQCKFGASCKFHHPQGIQIQSAEQENDAEQAGEEVKPDGTTLGLSGALTSFAPANFHNTKGLPIRLGEVDCPFYMKTGSCKYGATCRYNHPDRTVINPAVAAISHSILSPSAAALNIGVFNPTASLYQTIDPLLAQTKLTAAPTVYPQRPGQTECDFYMKTGECKFGERCRFHHPVDRTGKQAGDAVKLTLAGLPRREGAVHCPYYMKTGACKFGATCKFDHPPPGEVMTSTASQGTTTTDAAKEE